MAETSQRYLCGLEPLWNSCHRQNLFRINYLHKKSNTESVNYCGWLYLICYVSKYFLKILLLFSFYLIILVLKDIINIILKMHVSFTSQCNLHFNIACRLQFVMEYLMCLYIFVQNIWRTHSTLRRI